MNVLLYYDTVLQPEADNIRNPGERIAASPVVPNVQKFAEILNTLSNLKIQLGLLFRSRYSTVLCFPLTPVSIPPSVSFDAVIESQIILKCFDKDQSSVVGLNE